MKKQCPFLNKVCLGNQCFMWKNESCIFVSYMETYIQAQTIAQMKIPIEIGIGQKEEVEIPTEIKLAKPEELAAKLIVFIKKEFPNQERYYVNTFARHFWAQKGINSWNAPAEITMKLTQVELLAQNEFDKEKGVKEKELLEKETEELPSLINKCVDWGISKGLKRLTLLDIDAFLTEKKLEISYQTKRSLHATANVKIKSK